jgi:hypothetical protein
MAIIRATNGLTYKVSNNQLAAALKEEEMWAGKLREALGDRVAYNEEKHRELAEEMDLIETRLGNYTGTIFDHVRSIFDDTKTRGFKHDLHFPQLVAQYKRYGFMEAPEQWVPPPDIQSREGSPALFLTQTQTLAPDPGFLRLSLPSAAQRPVVRPREQPVSRTTRPADAETAQPAFELTAIEKGKAKQQPAAREGNSFLATWKGEGREQDWHQANDFAEPPVVAKTRSNHALQAREMTRSVTFAGDGGHENGSPGSSKGSGTRKGSLVEDRYESNVEGVPGRYPSDNRWPHGVTSRSTKYTPEPGRPTRNRTQTQLKRGDTAAREGKHGSLSTPGAYSRSYLPPDLVAKLDANETNTMDMQSLRNEFAQMSQTAQRLDRYLESMEQGFSEHILGIRDSVKRRTNTITQEVASMRRGSEENARRHGLNHEVTKPRRLFLGKAKDDRCYLPMEEVIARMNSELDETHERGGVAEEDGKVEAEPSVKPRVGPLRKRLKSANPGDIENSTGKRQRGD